MKREDLVRRIAENANKIEGIKVRLEDVKKILAVVEDVTLDAIINEEEVPFKFGKIGGKTVPSRAGVNPATGEKIIIPEKKGYPYFKASKKARGKE